MEYYSGVPKTADEKDPLSKAFKALEGIKSEGPVFGRQSKETGTGTDIDLIGQLADALSDVIKGKPRKDVDEVLAWAEKRLGRKVG